MTSIAQNQGNDQREISATLKKLFTEYGIASLLRVCRGEKQKGVSAFEIFRYLLCLVFSDRSMYMQIVTGKFVEGFCKNTVYRFLNAAKTNWEKFVCALSERIINRTIRPLTSEERKDVFIFDDTMFSRTGGKKTELCSRVFDHVTMKYLRGYRLLTLGWSDGNSFLPIAGRLLASNKEKNIVGPKHPADRRSLAGKRRNEDDRTIGELFLMMVDELADTTFAHAMQFIVDAMLQTVREHFGLSDEQLLVFSQQFYDRLPASYQRFLQPPTTA